MQLLLTESSSPFTAKILAFTLWKTRGEFMQNVAFAYIYWCSPIGKSKVFQLQTLLFFGRSWFDIFPIVLLSGNSSIRSQFSITVNAGKRLFCGIYQSVNTWRMSCLPVFIDVLPV